MPQREWSQIISFPKGELSTLINCTLELASGFPGGSLLSGGAGFLLPSSSSTVPGRLAGLSRPSGSGQGTGGTEGHMPRWVQVQRSAWSPPPLQNPWVQISEN